MKETIIIGYSGHSFVIIDTLVSNNIVVNYYLDNEEKALNPYQLEYLGTENEEKNILFLKENNYFIAIGDNQIRRKIQLFLAEKLQKATNIISQKATISNKIILANGIFIGTNAIINALTSIGEGTIINTNAVIEHECKIGNYCHIAPSATLCGNVEVGDLSFIGANSVIKQNVKIGKNVIVGAGSVVIRDIPDDSKVVGNPAKFITSKTF